MPSLDAVLSLARLGFRMHPLQAKNKIPIVGKWQERATTAESTLRLWATQYKDCNWGIATGSASGIIVVDIDPKNGGDASWRALTNRHGDPITVSVKTGSGGTHYYFQYPKNHDIGNSPGNVGRGIDIRGNDGQVVAPGSIHPNGTPYTWINSPYDCEVAPMPEWLLALVLDKPASDYDSMGSKLEKGNRNNSMYHAALALAKQGTVQEFAVSAITQWVRDQGHHDISETEIVATVESAYAMASKKVVDVSERSDTFNAEMLINTYGDDLIYVTGMGWFHWNGKVWEPDPDDAVVSQLFMSCMKAFRDDSARRLLDVANRNEAKELAAAIQWAVKSLSAGSIRAAVDLATTFPKVRRNADSIDSVDTLWLLNCTNGTIDLRTGELRRHCKEDMITKMVNVDYDPAAACPFWESTFDIVFNGNTNLTNFMQRALGYSITGAIDERCFFICWGESGANGKSTILETVQDLLGTGYSQMSDMVVITSNMVDNRVASSLAKLQGARFVSMNEAEDHQKLSEALVKQLTGGDTIQACHKYKNPFEYKPWFKLWIRTNERPIIRSQTNSIWDRIKLIPFERSIPKELRRPRSEVDALLNAERPGILAWLVRGASMWQESGSLGDPAEVSAAVNGYRTDSDIVRLFLDECADESPQSKVKSSDAYQAFVGWSRDAGERYIMSRTKFTQRCAALLDQPTSRSGGSTYIHGMKLNAQASMFVT